ncbi:TPA: hypothetical protein MA058_003444 [Klebsiella pneumoniae]|nr:hypothetical protein [Klebsiella pneumoniae]
MKYQHIKIDMDYCADPLWVSVDGIHFVNDSLSEYEDRLSKELLHGLSLYQDIWELSKWSKFKSPSDEFKDVGYEDSLEDLIKEMEIHLAVRLKTEMPDYHIYYCKYYPERECAHQYENVEITFEKPTGIYRTLVN